MNSFLSNSNLGNWIAKEFVSKARAKRFDIFIFYRLFVNKKSRWVLTINGQRRKKPIIPTIVKRINFRLGLSKCAVGCKKKKKLSEEDKRNPIGLQ